MVFSNVGTEIVHSNKSYVDPTDGRLSYIDNEGTLIMEQVSNCIIPRIFQKHKPLPILQVPETDRLVTDYVGFFTKRRTAFFIESNLSQISFISFLSNRIVFWSKIGLSKLLGGDAESLEVPNFKVIHDWSTNGRNHFLISLEFSSNFCFFEINYDYILLVDTIKKCLKYAETRIEIPDLFYTGLIYSYKAEGATPSNSFFRMKDRNHMTLFHLVQKSELEVSTVDLETRKVTFRKQFRVTVPIKSFDVSLRYPYYVSIVDKFNLIHFFQLDGKELTTSDFSDFIKRGCPSLLSRYHLDVDNELSLLNVGVFSLSASFFLVLVENYALIFNIYYDDDLQTYKSKFILKSESSNELYLGKFLNYRYRANDRITILRNGILLASSESSFYIFDDNYDSDIFRRIGDDTLMINNINFKMLELMSMQPLIT